MKHTQLAEIKESTNVRYLNELAGKYKPGTGISSPRTNPAGLHGGELQGRMVLHVPQQAAPIPEAILQHARNLTIEIRQAP